MAGVVCDSTDAGAATIRLRTSLDGSTWSRWYRAPLEVADESGVAQAFTDPVLTGDARYVQVSASRAGRARRLPRSSGVRLVAIDPNVQEASPPGSPGRSGSVAATVAGVDLAQPALAASSPPVIVTRAEWGADEKLRTGTPSYAAVKMAFIHHTASGNTYTQADASGARARHLRVPRQEPRLERHRLQLPRRPLRHHLRRQVRRRDSGRRRRADRGFNTGSTGISVMGTFVDEAPPAETVTALERLLAWKLSIDGLDPKGTAKLTCGAARSTSGRPGDVPGDRRPPPGELHGVPGRRVLRAPPAIRANVARRMGSGGVGLDPERSRKPLISPNGDGVLDATDLAVGITTVADWRARREERGRPDRGVVERQGPRRPYLGRHLRRLGRCRTGSTRPSSPPRLRAATAARDDADHRGHLGAAPRERRRRRLSFSPNGDGQSETVSVTYSPAEACSIRVGILDSAGDVVRWLHGWRAQEARSYSVSWDGRITSGGSLVAAAEGQYRFDIERRDAAGNVARQGIKVVLDKTLAQPRATPATISPNGDGGPRYHQARIHADAPRRASPCGSLAGDEVVRTLALGDLAAGARSVDVGRPGRLRRVRRQLPARVHRQRRLGSRREQRDARELAVDLYRPRLYAAARKATAAAPPQSSPSRPRTRTAPRWTCATPSPSPRPPRRLGPSRLAARRQVAERQVDAGVTRRVHRDLPCAWTSAATAKRGGKTIVTVR